MQFANNSAQFGSSHDPFIARLRFLINKSPVVLKDHPFPPLFADYNFFPAGDNCLGGFYSLFRNLVRFSHIVALTSFRVPFSFIIGVSRHGGLNPPASPYPP